MTASPPNASETVGDPTWLAHRYDPTNDTIHFRHVSRDGHSGATFLTDEELGPISPIVLTRARVMAAATTPAPLHFILHSAFCGSTLLARAFDIAGTSIALKEPMILNDLVGWRHRGGDPGAVARVLDDALTLLSRPFAPGEAVIIKPSNVMNAFAPAILAMRPDARALLLYAPLRTYLGSIAKKGMWGRLWVRDLLIKQLRDGLVDLGFTPEDHLGQTDLQVAAVGWIAQQALFARLVDRYGPDRVRTLDSETLVAEPQRVLAALAPLYRLTIDASAVERIATGPVFTRHSKFGTTFGAAERLAEHRDAADTHAEEIAKVATWAEAVADAAGVAPMPRATLLD